MGASVRTEDEAFSDERFADLAAAAGLADADHARGKMERLWRQCTLETVYVLPRETVTRILGDRGVEAIIAARLGEEVDGGIRIRGTRGRIEWLRKLRKNGKFGSKGGRPKRNPDGFPNKPSRVSQTPENETPPTPTPTPVPTLIPIPPDPDPDPRVVAPRKRSAPPAPGHAETIADFSQRFETAYKSKPSWDGRKAKDVQRLLKAHGEPEVRKRIAALFAGALAWPHPPYDFDTFVKHFDKLASTGAGRANGRAPPVGRVEPKQPHEYPEGDQEL